MTVEPEFFPAFSLRPGETFKVSQVRTARATYVLSRQAITHPPEPLSGQAGPYTVILGHMGPDGVTWVPLDSSARVYLDECLKNIDLGEWVYLEVGQEYGPTFHFLEDRNDDDE